MTISLDQGVGRTTRGVAVTDEPWRDDDLVTGPQVARRLGCTYRSWQNAVRYGLVPRAAVPLDPRLPAGRGTRLWRWGDVKGCELPGRGRRTDLRPLPRQCPDCEFTITGLAAEFTAHRASVHGE